MKVDFEWRIVPAEGSNLQVAYVIERMAGHDSFNQYGPMPHAICVAFVTARRNFVRKKITTRYAALKVFEPRPELDALLKRQIKQDQLKDQEDAE